VDTVLKFIPSTAIFIFTSSSAKAWNFLGTSLSHKVVYLKERNDSSGPVHPARLLISENELVHDTVVREGDQLKSKRRRTKGPIAAISTTTKDFVEVDDESRHASIWVDESPEQTRRIIQANFEAHEPLSTEEIKTWEDVQLLIAERSKRVIRFPSWFSEISKVVTSENLAARRYFKAFLQACCTIALIRSFPQRHDGTNADAPITVRFTDFAIAALIFNPVFSQSLDRADDEDLDVRRDIRSISKDLGGQAVRASDLAKKRDIPANRAYALLRKAAKAGAVHRVNEPTRANLKLYLPSNRRSFLPEPEEVFEQLDSLPTKVKFVDPITGTWVVYHRKSRHGAE
jgi:hypothetical protein